MMAVSTAHNHPSQFVRCSLQHAALWTLPGLTVSHHPHFSILRQHSRVVHVKWNSIHVLNWGLVHSIILCTKCCAPAIVMHWQLSHTCQSSLRCLLLIHNALPVRVCFSNSGFLHSTPNHLLLLCRSFSL